MVHLFEVSVAASLHFLACVVPNSLTRPEAARILDRDVLPAADYGNRIRAGRDAQGLHAGQAVNANDPVLARTYGEFPLQSLDTLLDAAVTFLPASTTSSRRPLHFCDLGSGCGRLCLYTALTHGGSVDGAEESSQPAAWKVHGIEISDVLHEEAVRAQDAALKQGWLQEESDTDNQGDRAIGTIRSSLSLHLGAAQDFSATILKEADLIFAYSTTWTNSGFSPDAGAMILSDEWNSVFSSCKQGCVVVTTDRALDPRHGWKLLDRHDVPNPEVFESTGYIQTMEK
jgi:hypothetical protein